MARRQRLQKASWELIPWDFCDLNSLLREHVETERKLRLLGILRDAIMLERRSTQAAKARSKRAKK